MAKNTKIKEKQSTVELLEQKSTDQGSDRINRAFDKIKQNRLIFGILLGVVVLTVGGYFIYTYIKSQQEAEAQEQMFAAVYYFEADSLKKALKGDGNYPGFEEIINDYPLSKAANLAHFYAGTIYLKQGQFNKAIEELKSFSSGDLLIQARAYSLIGDAYMEQNKLGEAITYYQKASNYKPNKQFTPAYLLKLALACELKKDYEEAIKAYDRIITEYHDVTEVSNAKKYKARLQQMLEK